MSENTGSLRATFNEAENKRSGLDNRYDSNTASFQEILQSTLQLYEKCIHLVQQLSLFSSNETLEDIGTTDLQYLTLDYYVAELCLKINGQDQRKDNLLRSRRSYEHYLKRIDDYRLLSRDDSKLYEQYQDNPNKFSTAGMSDAAARRAAKINRFREEKALKQKLDFLRQNPQKLQSDDDVARDLHLTQIAYSSHSTFQSLESIAQEIHILSLAPPTPPPGPQQPQDSRERTNTRSNEYSERLDGPAGHLSAGMKGPLLDSKGKPLRPFTILGKREQFRDGVFRPDHSLPTMTIDEYLEEERKRGGIIEGGGPQSGIKPEVDEDDMDAADAATMKAREWDEFVEANPKGSGNTLNRG